MTKLLTQMSAADDDQPWVPDSAWLLLEEAHSKFPVLADVDAARVRLARRWNSRPLPKEIEIDLAWHEHITQARRLPRDRRRRTPTI